MSNIEQTRDKEFIAHIDAIKASHKSMTVEMPIEVVVCTIAQIQLALRHPNNVGPSADISYAFVSALIEALDGKSPGFGELLNLGWDEKNDVKEKP